MKPNRSILDSRESLELELEILSFAGGENTISEDQAMKVQEARVLENWDCTSLGGMERTKGINKVGDGGASYSAALDLLLHHKDASGTELYGIIAGDLVKLSEPDLLQEDAAAFTSGVLSHGVSVLNKAAWITNQVDGLKKKTVGAAITTPASVPTNKCDRIYQQKNRLVAEGAETFPYRIFGSRAGIGNWDAADAWSLSNDAWSIDLPEDTRGCVMNFPGGNDILAFTERESFVISNQPNVGYRSFVKRGNAAPYALTFGDEGVYFVSRYPTLGVFLLQPTGEVTELTEFNRDVFVEKINFSQRIYGTYKDRKFYLSYSETDSGLSYPHVTRVYDARFGRWMNRPVNPDMGDTMGYPALLKYTNNELYMGSSQVDKLYEFGVGSDDEGQDTQATYKTKDFSSRDWAIASGGQFPVDDVRLKLLKAIITYSGTVGTLGLNWSADRGLHSGSKSVNLTASGDLIGSTFIVGTSLVSVAPPDKTVAVGFPNNAIGRRFNFELTNSGQSTRPKIKKIKIVAVAYDEL